MSSDLDEFYNLVGKNLPTYRICPECNDVYIVKPDTYDKPMTECDPGYCPYYVAICLCKNEEPLYSLEAVAECTYPDCQCGDDE